MKLDSVPLLYFKPTIFLVDDNRSFLEGLSLELSYPGLVETFTNPALALTELTSRKKTLVKNAFVEAINQDEVETDRTCFALNFQNILNTASNSDRFTEVGVVVVDYSMPGMNGFTFCQNIAHLDCLKIMLTAEADHKVAVDAFNAGIIDKFIIKDPESTETEIKSAIMNFVHRYFIDFSASLIANTNRIWTNNQYISVVNEWINTYDIARYLRSTDAHNKFSLRCSNINSSVKSPAIEDVELDFATLITRHYKVITD